MEICVNEYVRTKDGYIGKLVEYIPEALNYLKIYVGREIKHSDDTVDNFIYTRYGFQLKHSKNIIDLIEDEDIVILEYKFPKYRERITRKFEVSKIDDDIMFENSHCDFHCKVGDKKITDMICKNIKIKSIATKEQLSNIEYIVEE